MVKLSIIIAVYNQEDLIVRCLDSLPHRDDIEVIVIDDGSVDSTWEAVNKWKIDNISNFNNIILSRSALNEGPGPARNKGIELSSGINVMFVDSDDWLYEDSLRDILDNICDKYDVIEVLSERNDNVTWVSKFTWRGAVIKKSIIGNIRFNKKLNGEDVDFKNKIKKSNSRLRIFKYDSKPVYHYNEPRVGSLTWLKINGKI